MEHQIYYTKSTDEYHHILWKASSHYEVYFSINHIKKAIAFLLGSLQRTLKVQEQTRYAWKLRGDRVYCNTLEELEQALLASQGNRFGVYLGQRALNTYSIIL